MPFDVRVISETDLRAVSRRLRQYGDAKAVRKELTAGLRQAVIPAVQDVKVAALALPSHGRKHTGLRRRMAAATSAQVKTGGMMPSVNVRISRARMGNQAALPRLIDQGSFRHPVFGEDVWVTQRGQYNWFEKASRAKARAIRAEIKKTVDRLEQRLARRH